MPSDLNSLASKLEHLFSGKNFYQPKTYQTQNRLYTISCNKQ